MKVDDPKVATQWQVIFNLKKWKIDSNFFFH